MQINGSFVLTLALSAILPVAGAPGQTPEVGANPADLTTSSDAQVAEAGGCEQGGLGSWELLPFDSNLFIVHGALLPTGKVIWWSGNIGGGAVVSGLWDPITDEQSIHSFGNIDIACAGHAHLADGGLLVVGGGGGGPNDARFSIVFDPFTETWTQVGDMTFARWYPTAITIGDGRVLVFSGDDGGAVQEVESYDPDTQEWTVLPASADRQLEIYPGLHLMPDGRIIYTGTRWNGGQGWAGARSALFDPQTNTWESLGPHVIGDRSEGFGLIIPELEPGVEAWRIMVAGGFASNNFQNTAEVLDLLQPDQGWTQIANMNFSRNNANGVILPDGQVVFTAGIDGWKWGPLVPTLEAEFFDPVQETWTVGAAMQVTANYHSIGILLPDGRVLKTGGHDGGPEIFEMELYSPPYLNNGPRPTIVEAPEEVTWGQQFTVTASQAASITQVSMIRITSLTHHTNTDQRFCALAFEHTGGSELTITAPAHGNVAPPGYYMLFILNDCGVPSVAAMVRVGEVDIICPADFNGNLIVGTEDLLFLLGHWGDPGGPADLNGDGAVNTIDLLELLGAWGPCT